jgi:predicted Zn-dependent protease
MVTQARGVGLQAPRDARAHRRIGGIARRPTGYHRRVRRLLPLLAAAAAACSSPPRAPSPAAPPPRAAAPAPRDTRADVLLARARQLRADGDLAGARSRLEAALQLAPGSDPARVELAELLIADGRELGAAATLLDGVSPPSQGARWLVLRGQLAELTGDAASAADVYARALALAPDPDVRVRRALALEQAGREAEALPELEAAAAERPGDAVVRSRLATRYESAGRLSEAEALLRAEAEEAPARSTGWGRLAAFYQRTGRPEDARAAAARADAAAGKKERVLRPLLRAR